MEEDLQTLRGHPAADLDKMGQMWFVLQDLRQSEVVEGIISPQIQSFKCWHFPMSER